jgi:hypothetical protein
VEDNLIEVKLSESTVVKLKELTGDEQFDADAMLPSTPNQFIVASTRAAASVREINGESMPRAKNPEDIRRVLKRLTGRELDTLMARWAELFAGVSIEEDAKN